MVSERKEPLLYVRVRVERTVEVDGTYVHVRLYQIDGNPWSARFRVDPAGIGGEAEKVLERLELLAAEVRRAIELIREVTLK